MTDYTFSGTPVTGGTVSVISLAEAKAWLGVTGTDDDDLITIMIEQASLCVAKELGMANILETTYERERHDGDGVNNLYLNNWPVTDVIRIAVWHDDALRLTYGGTGSHATVTVTDSACKLRTTASGTRTTSSFPFSSYTTVQTLSDAISAITGWTATPISGFADYPSSELLPRPAANALDETVDLEVPEESQDEVELASSEWGILYRRIGWTVGVQNITADYTAGWDITNVPQPIQSAVYQLVALLYGISKNDGSMKEEKIGDYSYKLADKFANIFGDGKAQALIRPMLLNYYRQNLMGF